MADFLKKLFFLFSFCAFSLLASAQLPVYFIWQDTFCSNQIVLVNNNFYGPNNPSGTELLPGAAANGADSIIQINFTFFQPTLFLLEQDLCTGDTVWVNNNPYHAMRWLGEEKIFGGAANGCDSVIQIRLNVRPVPQFNLIDTLCEESSVEINGVRYDAARPQGREILEGGSVSGCDSIVDINLHFRQLDITLGPDRSIGLGDTVCLPAALNFTPAELVWTLVSDCQDDDCLVVCIQPLSNTPVTVTAVDIYGCEVSDTIQIRVEPESKVFIPNAFKPDADNQNNRFFISTDNSVRTIRRWIIADRWGDIVFDKESVPPNFENEGWDGRYKDRPMPGGVYVWMAELETIDGRSFTRSGSITLVR